ncbi:hypothetical protein IQ273_22470 [Nodosilinea sp. LEGE 07298]|uniref:hypothetical protein n=1 Tax=Nodosilinea sp. LEGE 07298 TaxID=2777970 RepID=UPI00187DEF03|nr:hypothetical protein [Nodosilinea sp. LEGE 07298]MBE9112173.1 hypothetical protein [Nodosilinea sp. LEGE 07298]
MDAEIADYIASVILLAKATFHSVQHSTDSTPKRSILRLEAGYGSYRVLVTELFSDNRRRKYRYYLLQDNYVEAGFDNSPDPRAIRLKYGSIGQAHVGELIPHLHQVDKTELTLTDEIVFQAFVQWLQENYPTPS